MTSASKVIHAGPDDSWHGIVSPNGPFQPEAGRYHLYIGLFCPFAHRAYLVRHLKGLQDAIGVSVVKPYPKGNDEGWPGWQFPGANGPGDLYEGATADMLFGSKFMHEVYFKADPEYKGRFSVPVLWDTKTDTMVNNESHELLRWMPTAFDSLLPDGSPERQLDLYPEHLRAKIDEISEWMQRDLNTGVYKAGFARSQEEYEENVPTVFAALNHLESITQQNGGPYILGKELTELDIRAYATIVRFDAIYVQHFKCNLGTIRGNYPVIHNWLKNLYWNVPGFKETTDFRHIKENVSDDNRP
ncbi:glutathione s-transferase [Apiospora hydei]|uniref:Glutathione s-transferase n=1 Tax=Apiospora hydei TaxID=1337664 RepID=A0ABR1V676_9PEZI